MVVISPVLLVALVVVLASGASAVWLIRMDRRIHASLDRIEASVDEMDRQLQRMERRVRGLVHAGSDEVTLPGPRRAAE